MDRYLMVLKIVRFLLKEKLEATNGPNLDYNELNHLNKVENEIELRVEILKLPVSERPLIDNARREEFSQLLRRLRSERRTDGSEV